MPLTIYLDSFDLEKIITGKTLEYPIKIQTEAGEISIEGIKIKLTPNASEKAENRKD